MPNHDQLQFASGTGVVCIIGVKRTQELNQTEMVISLSSRSITPMLGYGRLRTEKRERREKRFLKKVFPPIFTSSFSHALPDFFSLSTRPPFNLIICMAAVATKDEYGGAYLLASSIARLGDLLRRVSRDNL